MRRNSELSIDRRDLRWRAEAATIERRPFAGIERISELSREITNGIHSESTNDIAEVSGHQVAPMPELPLIGEDIYQAELPIPDSDSSEQTPPSLREETRGVKLGMFLPENAEAVDSGKLAGEFFGYERKWLAASVNKDSDRFKNREARIKENRMKKNPTMTEAEYDAIRTQELDMNDRFATKRVNKRFRKAVSERFGVHEEQAIEFAEDQFQHANDTMRYTIDTLYPHRGALYIRNEAVLPPISPAETVRTLASQNTDPVLQSEERRRHLLAFISGEIDANNRGPEAVRRLSKIQALLDRELFAGKVASTTNVKIRALFDDETNDVTYIDKIDGRIPNGTNVPLPDGMHMKTCEVPMRPVAGTDILTLTNPNQKREAASVIKALRKAFVRSEKGEDDLVDGASDVQDIHRIKFAVFGGQDQRDILLNRVFDILTENQEALTELDDEGKPIFGGNGKVVIEDITDDSQTNGTKDQSDNVKFRRIQVQFSDLPVPVEIIFQDMKGFLTSEYQVGRFDRTKGKYKGASHDLYAIHRLMDVRGYLLPQSIYKNINLKKEAIKTLKAKAQQLLSIKRGALK